MRIALFTGNYNYVREGANQALNHLVDHVERAGHEVRVYSPVTDTPAFAPKGTLVPVPSVTLPVRSEFQLALGLPRRTRCDLDAFGPDLVHVATPDLLGTRAQGWARRRGVPVVASLHTRFETYFEHYGAAWLRPVVEALLRRFYRRSDCVLVPTSALDAEMRRLRGDDQVRLWSRGVDRSRFDPARRDPEWRRRKGWTDDHVVILFFGRPVLEKGVDIFIATLRRLQAANPMIRALIVGAGPAAERFRALPGAALTGHLDGRELGTAVASADILFHASTTEAFPNVVLEAMASGLALVSVDSPSVRALIDPGITGLLSPDAIDSCAECLAALAADPAERRRLGRNAREASAAFSWEAASRSVERAYAETLAGRRLQ